jgi:peptidoglycan hydrolase CwlO-like protein
MPRPKNERESLEQELDELPAQIAAYQRELDATSIEFKERRERLEWQIRRAEKRIG